MGMCKPSPQTSHLGMSLPSHFFRASAAADSVDSFIHETYGSHCTCCWIAMTTTDISVRINRNAINDADHGMARELLYITDSAVDALSLNCSRSGFANRDQKSDSSFVTVQARNTVNVENLSADSQSSTASEILRRSTHASAAFSVPPSAETARLVRVPVKVLREVPLPHDGRFSGSVAEPRDNFKADDLSERKPNRLTSAGQLTSDVPPVRKLNRNASEESNKVHTDASKFTTDNARISRKSLASELQTADRVTQNELIESSPVHPLMAILDNGYLTQPIHTIVAQERPLSVDSHSTSMGTSASPIEVLAEDRQTSRCSFLLEFLLT